MIKLSFQQHKICQTVYFKLKHISSVCRFLTEDAAKTLVTSCVLSWLDYFNSWVHLILSSNLSKLLHVYTPSCTLHSYSDTRMLKILQYKHETRRFCTFSFGPHIWNSLPQDLRYCSTLSSFKAKLKTFLFSQYFHPN